MNIRNGHLRTFAALGTLTTLAFSTVQAGQSGRSENNLVGITLRSSTFRDVLRKYGQPDEVQGGGPFLPTPPKGAAPSAGGDRGGSPGMPGMPGSGGSMYGSGGRGATGGGGGGKRATSKNGFPGKSDSAPAGGGPGSGGPGGYAGGPGSGGAGGYPGAGSPGGYPGAGSPGGYAGGPGSGGAGGYPGAGGPGGYPGGPGSGGSGGGKGLPGFGGETGGGGPAGLPGSGEGGGADQAGAVEKPITEATWWYHNNLKGYHMSFLFNKAGRVIQIQEYGVASLHSGKTRQGIALGSNMTQVLSRYGWSNDGAHDGENVIMRYGGAEKVAFQMVKNKVLGITVAVGR